MLGKVAAGPAQMEEIIASGKADVIEMARALLADPELPNKVMSDRPEEILHCLRCFACMAERPTTQTRRCAINPRIGRELEGMEILPARKSKRVLVAGGGVAGMEAALVAAQRGHDVTLCEASAELGGILKEEQAIPFKHEMYQLGVTLETLIRKEGVKIRLNTPVTAEFADAFAADAKSQVVPAGEIPDGWMGLDIGPKTVELYTSAVADAGTVIWNGPMGVFEFPAFAKGTEAVAEALSKTDAITIVGGGDSAAAVEQMGFADKITHISTGGGASLEFLEGLELPGVACLLDK